MTLAPSAALFVALCVAAPAAPAAPTHHKPRQAAATPPPEPLGPRPELLVFARELAETEGWDVAALSAQLTAAQDLARVKQLILPPVSGTAKNWAAYRERFVEPKRIDAGVAFWNDNAAALARAESRYGVPAEIIVGIIGVETFYGRVTGGFKVLDALATLAFDFPPQHPRAAERRVFFRNELADFLRLCRELGLDAAEVRGSYAGALGWPQFMPGSWRRYAVDFDGDGRIDLIASPADAIGSVANFLVQHGWQPGMLTHYTVAAPVDTSQRARLLAPDILPSFSPAQFAAAGAVLSQAGQEHNGLLAFIELQNGAAAPQYIAGTANFYALTRYNWSSYYAMSVLELGRAVRTRRQTPPGTLP